MPVISCTKFGMNQTILTVFSGVQAKKPPPELKKAENAVAIGLKVYFKVRNFLLDTLAVLGWWRKTGGGVSPPGKKGLRVQEGGFKDLLMIPETIQTRQMNLQYYLRPT